MSNINLLPWRDKLRAQQKRAFIGQMVAAALAGALIAASAWLYYMFQVDGQNQRNAYLQDKISVAEKRIEAIKDLDTDKQRLLGRKEVIEALQNDRARVVKLFETLSRTTPDGIVLTLVKQSTEGMAIEGRAQSNTRVSNYMRALEDSGLLQNPSLSIIEASKPEPGLEDFPYQFKLSVGLAKLEDMTSSDGTTSANTSSPMATPMDPGKADALVELQAVPAEATTDGQGQDAKGKRDGVDAPIHEAAPGKPVSDAPTDAPPPLEKTGSQETQP